MSSCTADADACDPKMSCTVVSVRSNEPDTVNGHRDDLPGDFRIVGPRTVQLRAERLGGGSGRIYQARVTTKSR